MKHTTVLFDLDGTIVDSSRGVCTCFKYAMEKMGFHLEDEYKGCLNHLIYNCEAGHLPPLSDVEHELRILQTDYRLGDFVYIMKMKNFGFDDYMCLKIAHAGCSFAPSIKTIK